MIDALKEEFITEIEDMIDSSIASLLSLEQESISKVSPHVQNIMRYLHSAKGGCSMFDFPQLSHGFHEIEDLFLEWVEKQSLPVGGLDYMFYFFDQAKNTLRTHDNQFHISAWGEAREKNETKAPSSEQNIDAQNDFDSPQVNEKTKRNFFRNSLQSSISHKISHHTDFNAELLAYIIDPDQKNVINMVRKLREHHFLTKNFSNLTRSMMSIQEDHPDVIIMSSQVYNFMQFNVVSDLQRKKIPIPIIVVDESFSDERLKGWLEIGIKAVIANPQDIDLLTFKARSHGRSYRSQKLLNESLNILIYQLGVINYPGQTLIPEQQLEELKASVKSLIKAKKEFSDIT